MKRYAILILLALLAIGAAIKVQITITEYRTPSGAICFGDPDPFDCEFPPGTQVPLPSMTPSANPATLVPTGTPTASRTATLSPAPSLTRTASPVPTTTRTATAVPPLLVNGDFEATWSTGWTRYDRWPDLPAFNDERGHPESRHNGAQSLRIFNEFRCHLSGVYQRVPVTQFQTYVFSAWVRTFGSSSSTFPGPSDLSITDAGEVGIDPNGGIDPGATSVIWGRHEGTEQWRKVSVQAVALSNRITVFVQARLGVAGGSACQWPIPFLIGFVDEVTLVVDAP